jgi:DNA-directed RNA polymerase subunit RPC12/RpoP
MSSDRNNDEGLVREKDACPGCGERRADELVWVDEGESVECQTCGTRYVPK